MSTLLHLLKEANVSLALFCEKLQITEEEALKIAHTADDDTHIDTYLHFVTALNDESLLPKLLDFFAPFVTDKGEFVAFVTSVLRQKDNNIPRRMLNSIERLISLADDMESIRRGQHCLKIFYFVVCIETLYFLAGSKLKKYMIVIDFFDNFVTDADKDLILARFRRDPADDKFFLKMRPDETDEQYHERVAKNKITMEVFGRVINELRNCFAHEGDYWNFHFADNGYSQMNSLLVAENYDEYKLLQDGKIDNLERTYSVDLTYNQFRTVCVKGFLQFVRAYLE